MLGFFFVFGKFANPRGAYRCLLSASDRMEVTQRRFCGSLCSMCCRSVVLSLSSRLALGDHSQPPTRHPQEPCSLVPVAYSSVLRIHFCLFQRRIGEEVPFDFSCFGVSCHDELFPLFGLVFFELRGGGGGNNWQSYCLLFSSVSGFFFGREGLCLANKEDRGTW